MKRGIILAGLVCIVFIILVGGVVSATLLLSVDSPALKNARWLSKDSSSQGNINQYIATATPINPPDNARWLSKDSSSQGNINQYIATATPINPPNNENSGDSSALNARWLSGSGSSGVGFAGLTGNSRVEYCTKSCPPTCCDVIDRKVSCTVVGSCPGPTPQPTRPGACTNPPKGDLVLLISCFPFPIRQDKIILPKTPIQNPEKSNTPKINTPTSIHLPKPPIQNPEKSNTPSRENQPLANNPKGIDSRSDAFQGGFGNPFSLPIFAGGFQNLPQFAGIQNNMWPNNQGVPNIPNQQPNQNQAANNNILPQAGDDVGQVFANVLPEEVGQPPQQNQQQPGAQPEQVASDNVIPKGPPYLNGESATYSPGFGDLWESVKNFFNNLF